MEQKIRFGVAGLGRIGWQFHCPQLANHADCELTAVVDTDAERRAEAEATYHCRAFASFDEMLSSGLVDAVTIATPTHLHEAMACAAFAAGKHVILEKPMAPTVDSAQRIAAAAVAAGRQLTIYQPHRLNAYFQHLLSIVKSGRIGRIYAVQRSACSYARRNDWQSLKAYGGGMLNNYGAHYLDQILQIIGYDIPRVFCNLQLVSTLGDADDVVKIMLVNREGVTADLQISQAATTAPYEFIVWGSCGTIELNGKNIRVRSFDPAALEKKELDQSLKSPGRKYPNDRLPIVEDVYPVDAAMGIDLYADYAKAVRTGGMPFVPPSETVALMGLLARCRESAGTECDLR